MRWNPNCKTTRIKKDAHKKIFIVLLSFTLAFTAFIQSEQKASANPLLLTVPAGITAGAGAYLGGALMLSGLVGAVGLHEYQNSINEHAWSVWDEGATAAKDSLNLSIQAAVGAGNVIESFGTDTINFFEKNLDSMMQQTYNISKGTSVVDAATGVNFETRAHNSGQILYIGSTGTVAKTIVNGVQSPGMHYTNNPWNHQIEIYSLTGSAADSITITLTDNKAFKDAMLPKMQAVKTLEEATTVIASLGVALTIGGDAVYQDYIGVQQKGKETWETMRDAGLVLPVDGVTTYVGDIPVRVNEQGNAYTDDAGTVYNPADVDYAFPVPRIRTEDVPVPGIYTDTPALTGNPAIDQTIIGNPAIPHTTTNITTGQTVANPDIPIGGGGTPTNPPPETPAPLPRVPGSQGPVPIMMFLAFFDLLRALIMYLVRMFNWIMTIPFVPEKPIDNPYFQWFRQAKILGVYPYTLITSMAAFFLSFKLVTAVRRFLP